MIGKKKIAAIVLGAMLGFGGTTQAAGADSFSDVPKGHWSYEALDYLAENGIIEGMGDGSFQGNRTMTRYEMAAIVYRALQNGGGDFGTQSVLERLRTEYGSEIDALKAQVQQNTQDIQEIRSWQDRVKLYGFVRASYDSDSDRERVEPWNGRTNNRFYLNLMADLKVSDQWTGHFQSETNQRWARNPNSGHLQREDGQIQRVWISGNLPGGVEINAGRRWAPLGHQFSLLGATTNGIDASVPFTGTGLRIGGFYYSMGEYDEADFDFWGPIIKGQLFKNFDVQLAYARVSGGVNGALETPWNAGDYGHGNWIGDHAFLASFRTPIMPNVNLTADYVQTDHKANTDTGVDSDGDRNKSYLIRLDYKWVNPSVRKSFTAYVRYHMIDRNGTIWNDDAWSSMLRNSRGWTFGFAYVPWKNVVWENFYVLSDNNLHPYAGETPTYKRHLFRTQLDFHF